VYLHNFTQWCKSSLAVHIFLLESGCKCGCIHKEHVWQASKEWGYQCWLTTVASEATEWTWEHHDDCVWCMQSLVIKLNVSWWRPDCGLSAWRWWLTTHSFQREPDLYRLMWICIRAGKSVSGCQELVVMSLQVERHRAHLFNYIVFLRITPFLPNWFINMVSPVINVPLSTFFIGTFFGLSSSYPHYPCSCSWLSPWHG